jgi:hypothetical protein
MSLGAGWKTTLLSLSGKSNHLSTMMFCGGGGMTGSLSVMTCLGGGGMTLPGIVINSGANDGGGTGGLSRTTNGGGASG